MTGTGMPIDDKLNSMTIGERGPLLMQVRLYFFHFVELKCWFSP